ncbi:MAG TPA: hypothetical protein VNW52_08795, partial [Burkholderiaceae bacterium]|nr:hypothetical protein [Burkholderiaceae bacterium]
MDGVLCYEYNGFATTRTKIRATEKLPAGHYVVDAQMDMSYNMLNAPATVKLHVNGKEVAKGKVPFTALSFTATGTFNVGRSVGSPVSLDYFDRTPFAFTGKINDVHVLYQ